MESLDYWRLCDELNVIQAALLIQGEDPSSSQSHVQCGRTRLISPIDYTNNKE